MISCKPVTKKIERHGKKMTVTGSEVVCADTVLFPEGGGQNTDHGSMFLISDQDTDQVSVLSVTRHGSSAVHLLDTAVDWSPGARVRQRVDWSRQEYCIRI